MKKFTLEDFVRRSKKVHGDIYDYSTVVYINSQEKVDILCLEHGVFSQKPSRHLGGQGCPSCSGNLKMSTSEFIDKARVVHGEKFDYSDSNYRGAKEKITIRCPTHGLFYQSPNDHLTGHGCKKCGSVAAHAPFLSSTEEFIASAVRVHGNKYDYSFVEYAASKKTVDIICRTHGAFSQLPNNHLGGVGCPSCATSGPSKGEIELSDFVTELMSKKTTTEDFIEKARAVHGDKYDYSKTKYVNAKTKLIVSCFAHGDFLQTPGDHTQGYGCKPCGIASAKAAKTWTQEEFIAAAINAHGSRYDYSVSKYLGMFKHVNILCLEHGVFSQIAKNHILGHGCSKCGGSNKLSNEEFIAKASAVHGEIYDYSKVEYVNSDTAVDIICREHGVFSQIPYNHLIGKGCLNCAGNALSDTTAFVAKARKVHGDKYDYSLVVYVDSKTKVDIICKTHGVFSQVPSSHLSGRGCSACISYNSNTEEFITKARAVHGDKYDYSKVEYVDSKTKVVIRCRIHGDFEQVPNGHLNGAGCIPCSDTGPSSQELALSTFASSLVGTVLSDRSLIAPQEIDCLVPSKKLGIEFCGVYFHSEKFKLPDYHLKKLQAVNAAGHDLIQVFEDEWLENQHIVKSILKNKLGFTDTVIHARKTRVSVVPFSDCKAFLDANHLQGSSLAPIRLGLYLGEELVMVASFSSDRKVIGGMPDGWFELVRLCTKIDTLVVGGFSKLLKHFIAAYSPKGIKTFCDKRYFNGRGYEAVGFVKSHDSSPNYFYVMRNKRYSRYRFQKHKLAGKLEKFDPALSEKQNMLNNGYLRIYDCGNSVYLMNLS